MLFVKNKANYYFTKGKKQAEKGAFSKAQKYFLKSSKLKYLKAKEYLACFDFLKKEVEAYRFATELEQKEISDRAYTIASEYLKQGKSFPLQTVKWLRFAGQHGNTEAIYSLGLLYLKDDVVERNSFTAFEYFEEAAEQGHLPAIKKVAEMYDHGQGCDQIDRELAIDYYFKAAKMGDASSMYEIGSAFLIGDTVIQDNEKAKKWFLSGAPKDDSKCAMAYAQLVAETDLEEALVWYKKAATLENTKAGIEAGKVLEKLNRQHEAIVFYEEAINEGSYEANLLLANCLDDSNAGKEHYLLTAADSGIIEAQLELGRFFFRRENKQKATEWLEKAANQGNLQAQREIADYYFNSSIAEEQTKGFAFLKEAAEQNDKESAFQLGCAYLNGTHCKKDNQSAGNWLKQAADLEHRRANYLVGIMHEQGIGLWKNHQYAFERISKAAQAGEPGAIYRLGVYYQNGIVESRDFDKALEQFQQARELGYAKASYSIGYLHESGVLTCSSKEVALKFYSEAMNQSIPEAFNNVANMYHNGNGVVVDQKKAKDLYLKAIDLECKTAKYNLGLMLFEEGEEKDTLAIKYLEEAAREDIFEAHSLLGSYYLSTEESDQSELALYHLEKAAKNGIVEAIEQLVSFYSNKNQEKAKYWKDALERLVN